MQNRQVFEQILGIVSPWFVAEVELALLGSGSRRVCQCSSD